jgi:hypothetical protein
MRAKSLVATLAVLLLIGIANVGQAADGDPLILGQVNTVSSGSRTSVTEEGSLPLGGGTLFRIEAGTESSVALGAACRDTNCEAVRGFAYPTDSIGVSGQGAIGVNGEGTQIGVLASGPVALEARGRTVFNRSGVVTIPAGALSARVTLSSLQGPLTSQSLILATPQERPGAGVFVRAAVPNVSTNSITIYLNKAVAGGVKIGWFILN